VIRVKNLNTLWGNICTASKDFPFEAFHLVAGGPILERKQQVARLVVWIQAVSGG
jgi:hypothetical protein